MEGECLEFERLDFLEVMERLSKKGARRLRVLLYITYTANPDTRIFHGTYADVARVTGLNYSTTSRIMKYFENKKVIESLGNGDWLVDEDLMPEKDPSPDEPYFMFKTFW